MMRLSVNVLHMLARRAPNLCVALNLYMYSMYVSQLENVLVTT